MSVCAPIALFIYNRPDHTRRVLQSLAENALARDSDLVVYADGPRTPEHESAVHAARAVARKATGFRSVRMVERDRNFGLANSMALGVTEVCAASRQAIIVEDDLVVSPGFLAFLNAGLQRYADTDNVWQISAYTYPIDATTMPDAYFLPMVSCWGWATWARAWKRYDPLMSALAALDRDRSLQRRFNLDDSYDYYGMACDQRAGRVDSWGIRWQLSLFAHNGLVIYPRESLVFNAGTDESGTHGAGQAVLQIAAAATASWSAGDWPSPSVHEQAFGRVKQLLVANRPSFVRRIIQRIRR
jgi:hypothetical protein